MARHSFLRLSPSTRRISAPITAAFPPNCWRRRLICSTGRRVQWLQGARGVTSTLGYATRIVQNAVEIWDGSPRVAATGNGSAHCVSNDNRNQTMYLHQQPALTFFVIALTFTCVDG